MALHDVHRHSGHCPLPTSGGAQAPHPAVAPRSIFRVSLRKVKPWVSPQLEWNFSFSRKSGKGLGQLECACETHLFVVAPRVMGPVGWGSGDLGSNLSSGRLSFQASPGLEHN